MRRRGPLTPIWDPKVRRGAIIAGNTPGSVYVPPAIPSSLSFVGRVTSSTQLNGAYALTRYGDYVVATATASATDNVAVIDVSNPASPSIVGNVQNSNLNSGHAVAISGSHAVVTCGQNFGRFTVVSLATPSSPSVVGSVEDSTNFFADNVGIAVIGTNAFVTSHARLGTLSIATPASPAFTNVASDATNYAGTNGTTPVVADGNTLYVGATNRITVVDVSTPTSPSVIGSVVDSGLLASPESLDLRGDTLLVVDITNERLTAVDVSTPASPTIIDSLDLSFYTSLREVRWMSDTAAVVLAGTLVLLVDVSNLSAMSVVDDYPDDTFTNNPWRICPISTADMFAISSMADDTVSILQVNY